MHFVIPVKLVPVKTGNGNLKKIVMDPRTRGYDKLRGDDVGLEI